MPFPQTIRSFLSKLTPREKVFLLAGIPLTVLILVYVLLIEPMQERASLNLRLIPKKESEIARLGSLSDEYQALSGEIEAIEGRLPGKGHFAPLSYLELIAKQNQVRENIVSIRSIPPAEQAPYFEVPMEVKMENMTLMRIVPFLNTIESSPYFLRIKRLNIKTRTSEPDKLDVTFVVSSYEKM
jgi:hypothetical protein